MSLNRTQLENLRQEINYRDVMTRKVGRMFKTSGILTLAFIALTYWGFSGMHDAFMSVPDNIRGVLKWIFLVAAIVLGILTIISFISFQRSKKYTLKLIDDLKAGK